MQVFVNLWGGEGFLTSASLLAMASVGMFDGIKDTNAQDMEMHCRCLDFTAVSPDDDRWKNMCSAINTYFPIIYGHMNSSVIFDNITINGVVNFSNPPTLTGKYRNTADLSIGCSEIDMNLNIRNGIYGKPWVGEAYHSDSFFNNLYTNANGDIIVINCGGYKGGGTAATFIPLENTYDIANARSVERFDVIAGPSTEFCHVTKIPNVGIYAGMGVNEEVDLFEIPQVIRKLESINMGGASEAVHKGNIDFLNEEYKKVKDTTANPPYDYSNLDPKYYMARFIDRIQSDSSMGQINASFINIKPDLTPRNNSFEYDVTSDRFMPDSQDHKIHITNILNAVTVQEIMMNHGAYSGGDIYTFCSPLTDKFTIESVFLPNDAVKLYRFIVMSVILVKYVYSYFDDISKAGAAIMLNKWAREIKVKHDWVTAVGQESDEGRLNNAFANAVKRQITRMAYDFIRPVLNVFLDVETTSNDTEFFPASFIPNSPFTGGIRSIVDNLLGSIQADMILPIQDPMIIKSETEKVIAALVMGKGKFNNDFGSVLASITTNTNAGNDFLTLYQVNLPTFGNVAQSGLFGTKSHREWEPDVNGGNVEQKALEYCNQIIGYTYYSIAANLI